MASSAAAVPAPVAGPPSLELVLATNESITIDLDPLPAPDELEVVVEVLVEEKPPAYFWTALAARCWNAGRRAEAELIVSRGCSILPVHRPEESTPVLALQAAFLLADARAAPKQVLDDAHYQPLGTLTPKQHYFRQAGEALSRAQSLHPQHPLLLQARAVLALVTGDNALAAKLFDVLLTRTPEHIVALLGRACGQLRARQHVAALQTYQHALRLVLRVNQSGARWPGPDPRIGIGLCLYALGHHDAAQRAWRRAAAVDPEASAPRLLLGLALMHTAKQTGPLPAGLYGASTERAEDEARRAAYADGLVHLQAAWQRNKTCAMAAVALASHLSTQTAHALAAQLPPAHDMSTPMGALSGEADATLARALKLSEHAVQYADARSVVIHAWLQFALALHATSRLPQHAGDHSLGLLAQRYYGRALEALARSPSDDSTHPLAQGLALAALSLAQLQVSAHDVLGAVQTLDMVLARPAASTAYASELALFAGLLLADPAPGTDPAEVAQQQRRARQLLDRVLRTAAEAHALLAPDAAGEGGALAAEHFAPMVLAGLAQVGQDARVHAWLAQLHAKTARGRALEQYEAALRLCPPTSSLAPALQLNVGALLVQEADAAAVRRGLTHLNEAQAAPGHDEMSSAVRVLASYNVGRAHEALSDVAEARRVYEALLDAHPAYVDARVRLAILAAQVPQDARVTDESTGQVRTARDVANTRFKEALTCEPGDLSVRAEYMRFLAGAYPANRQAAWAALKDTAAQLFLGAEAGKSVFGSASVARRAAEEARHDAYVLGTLGWAYYQLGLHAPAGPQQRAERAKSMLRAADLFDKALSANAQDVFAAQGLAILLADDALGDPNAAADAIEARRKAAAEDAAALFGKLREVRDDASVYVCQGHAFMLCGALERAAHVYELALTRRGGARDPAVLQYSARALYALGLRDRHFAHLQQAMQQLAAADEVLAARGSAEGTSSVALERKQLAFNRAVMAQKALQMLYDVPIEQRSSSDVALAIEWVERAQAALPPLVEAAQQGQLLYITADAVEQRIKYAEMSLLRQAATQLQDTKTHEAEHAAQLARLDEKQREKEAQLAQRQREKEEEHRRRAEALAESRRRAREEALQIEYVQEPEPEPKKRAPRKKKDDFVARDDEALFAESEEEEEAGADDEAHIENEEQEEAAPEADAESHEASASAPAPMETDAPDDLFDESDDEAPAPNSMRARLEALARERQQRQSDAARPKKRPTDKATRRDAKKARTDA
ncbi:protein required for normal CLN1 and CLN2 G1 cyclin expression [Malassezia equina]|uniref:Protein required for normal CLN1 and CLN2 G1 cyclin expression n=1 Tax=Malassezia equina TaxID=1381935 RepID=A0AAF0EBE8_9BASI|nr:protein required for normal CLN1 and CLN2 G1 cyclin expression [Malassezia equina]